MKITIGKIISTLTLIIITLLHNAGFAQDNLKAGFKNPPQSARPGVYWYFMDGNLSREGMTADLESMAQAGIGNLIFLEVNVGVKRGPIDFLSEKWQELFKHAVREAERLGIEITLGSGPGWAGSGGPWVKPEQSMQHLVADSIEVKGPRSFDGILPIPKPRKPYFEGAVTGELIEKREAYYEDVAVLAFPTPQKIDRIEDIDEKALYYRAPYTSRPGVKPYLPAPADWPVVGSDAIVDPEKIVDLSARLQPDGRINWEVPAGNWTIMRFGRRNNGATTRPAPKPGFGFECDKLDAGAFDEHFKEYVGKLLDKVGKRAKSGGWTMLHIDSWEMGSQNWTGRFREEFRKRRGYDLLKYLPTYTGRIVGSLEKSERFLWDVRLTAQELVLENHAGRFKELGRKYGLKLSIEPYDMNPTSDLALGGIADVPMCEFWSEGYGFDSSFSCFESTSIGHTLGRSVIAAESFTADHREAWKQYPAAMKNQGDWAFCTGINRLVYHTFAHKPFGRRPGMTMGPYGVHWDRGQTWWPMAAAYHRYITRCQYILRQGQTVADVCYLIPEGAPHVFRPPASALEGRGCIRDRRGYNFDGCAPGALMNLASVENGRVTFPSGASYQLLVLPSFDTMTPKLLRKLKTLIETGATVVGEPPQKSPSLMDYPQCDKEVAKLAASIWGQEKLPAHIVKHKLGHGQVVWGGKLSVDHSVANKQKSSEQANRFAELYPDYETTAGLLTEMGVEPDFEAEGSIRYTHRRAGATDIYFVANRTAEIVETDCTFRIAGREVELWDPLTGTIRNLPEYKENGKRTIIPMRFEPYQSFFIVFKKEASQKNPKSETAKNFPQVVPIVELEGSWEVSFDPTMGGPKQVKFDALTDWSKHSEPGIKYYSGLATYRKDFDLPEGLDLDKDRIVLELGEVHSLAQVKLNGIDLGVLWCAPWRVDITDALRKKGNRLEIEVANLWPNRLIGDKGKPQDQQFTWTTYNPYTADSPLLPSGLLGPVKISRLK